VTGDGEEVDALTKSKTEPHRTQPTHRRMPGGKKGRRRAGNGAGGDHSTSSSSIPPPSASAFETETEGMLKERQHLLEVVIAFLEYSKFAGLEIERRWLHLCRLSPKYACLLPPQSLAPSLRQHREAIQANQAFLNAVVQGVDEIAPAEGMVALAMEQLAQHAAAAPRQVLTSRANCSKIHATLHSCMREWSEDGATERAACFDVILDALAEFLPVTSANCHQQKVLVPGAGLGRLPLEIVHRGYACQGNEFSYFMLLTSNFLLNHVEEAGMFGLFPFVEQSCNIKQIGDNVRVVRVPDVCPAKLLWAEEGGEEGGEAEREQQPPPSVLQPPDFSMTAGEFLEVYGEQVGCWDAVVTCFFLDTAPVVIEYIEAIHRLLLPGGIWVNFGPLLYHWAGGGGGEGGEVDERYGKSVELSWEEVRHVMVGWGGEGGREGGEGFEVVREEFRGGVTYAADGRSMMRTVYDCLFFVAVKKGGEGGKEGGKEEGEASK